jgi:hypothetical protein
MILLKVLLVLGIVAIFSWIVLLQVKITNVLDAALERKHVGSLHPLVGTMIVIMLTTIGLCLGLIGFMLQTYIPNLLPIMESVK